MNEYIWHKKGGSGSLFRPEYEQSAVREVAL